MKIYLAHSSHEMDQGYHIESILKSLGCEVWNPFDKEKNIFLRELGDRYKNHEWEDNGKAIHWKEAWLRLPEEEKKEIADWITEDDHEGVDWADIVVMIYPEDGRTIGIGCEMEYSSPYGANKPLYIYAPTWLLHHPWVISYATYRTDDIYELLATVRNLMK